MSDWSGSWHHRPDRWTPPGAGRIAFPPEDGERVRRRLFTAVPLTGCEVLQVTTEAGTPLAVRHAPADEDRSA
ncbi:hypothetical protein ASD48_29220 [Streptomyces sp. Root1310]|nr:hypothetical protein ASD48_29220 [Streptomyces sp. Root1310]